jgi:four helix bundle protein
VKRFNDLIVWQKSMTLVERIYQVTASFPKEEIYGLTSQIRRAAISIPSNIAEGQSRHSTKEFLRFLSIALGSRSEVETQLIIASRLKYLGSDMAIELTAQLDELGRLLRGLVNSLRLREQNRGYNSNLHDESPDDPS